MIRSTALLSGGAIIDLDGTLFVQVALFFVAFVVLRGLVFRPMLRLFDAREQAIDGVRAQAEAQIREAEEKAAKLAQEMQRVRTAAAAEREALRAQGAAEERKMLSSVQHEVQTSLSEHAAQLQREAIQARAFVRNSASRLGADIARRVLGREVQS